MTVFTCIPKLGREGGGVVWDGEAGRVLARFDSNGRFSTEDATVINRLKELKYTAIYEDEKEDAEPNEKYSAPKSRGRKWKTE